MHRFNILYVCSAHKVMGRKSRHCESCGEWVRNLPRHQRRHHPYRQPGPAASSSTGGPPINAAAPPDTEAWLREPVCSVGTPPSEDGVLDDPEPLPVAEEAPEQPEQKRRPHPSTRSQRHLAARTLPATKGRKPRRRRSSTSAPGGCCTEHLTCTSSTR